MAVTVKRAELDRPTAWEKVGKTYRLLFVIKLSLDLTIDGGKERRFVFTFSPGYRCDGLSVPWAFRWLMKSWDPTNDLYNMAGAVHDWLYATKGNTYYFSREECDDIFRGILREAGQCRGKAGIADKAVEWFAGGSKHWGSDEYNVKNLVVIGVNGL